MQIMEGDLSRTIERHLSLVGHVQIADAPARHEPGTGEINYDFLLRFLDQVGYQGWIGLEYTPARPDRRRTGLAFARRLVARWIDESPAPPRVPSPESPVPTRPEPYSRKVSP